MIYLRHKTIFFYCMIWCIVSSQVIFAADQQKSEYEVWQAQVNQLKNSLDNFNANKDAQRIVFRELKNWGPDESSMLWKFPMWVRDLYLNDEDFRGTIRAIFLPSFWSSCHSTLTGKALECPLDNIVRASEIGMATLRRVHEIPYVNYSNIQGVIASFNFWKTLKSGATFLSHASALMSNFFETGAYQACDVGSWFGAHTLSYGFRNMSLFFTGVTAVLAMDGEYIDVALRSLERQYQKQERMDELLVVQMMIASRNQTKKKK